MPACARRHALGLSLIHISPEGANVALYSLGYNASVVGPDLAICLILALLPPTRRLIERLRLQANAGRRI